jgi:hypothetical protein
MSDRTFERAMSDWLESGSDRTPPAAIDAVLLAVKTTPQERDLRIPRRFNPMPTYLRLAAAIAIVAVLGVGAVAYVNQVPGPGGPTQAPPTPTPAPSPTQAAIASLPPLPTEGWTTYLSDRYGFSIDHPADWSEEPSTGIWTEEADIEAWTSTAPDSFIHPGASVDLGVKASVWAVRVEPGTTPASWIQAWCAATSGTECSGLSVSVIELETADGHPGVLSLYGDIMAAFLDGDVMYVVAVWRDETDPSVQPYGGTRRLIEAYISTLTLPVESPLETPASS